MTKNGHQRRKRSTPPVDTMMFGGHGAGNLGAATELEVSANLLTRGFAVYRNQSPVGPIDLLAVSESGEILKIQATTGNLSRTGARSYNPHDAVPLWDTLAVAYPDGVWYYDRAGTELELPGSSRRLSGKGTESLLKDARVELARLRAKVTNLEGRLRRDPQFSDEGVIAQCKNCVNSKVTTVKPKYTGLSVRELFQKYLSDASPRESACSAVEI